MSHQEELAQRSKASVASLLNSKKRAGSAATVASGSSGAADGTSCGSDESGGGNIGLLAGLQPGSEDAATFVSSLRSEHAQGGGSTSTAAFMRAGEDRPNGGGGTGVEYGEEEEEEDDDEWDEPVGGGGGGSNAWTSNGESMEAMEEEEYDDNEYEDDEDEWDEPLGGSSGGGLPAFGEMGAGGDLDILVDAPVSRESELGDDDKDEAESGEAEAPSAEQQAEQRRLKRQHNAQRRRRAEAMHRASLLCWLSHGRLLSDQSDDLLVQSRLLSLVPPELSRSSATSTTSGLTRIATWLHSYLNPPPSDAAPSASASRGRGKGGGKGGGGKGGGGKGGGGRGGGRGAPNGGASSAAAPPPSAAFERCEQAWRLVDLIRLCCGGAKQRAPRWANADVARAAAARLLLLRPNWTAGGMPREGRAEETPRLALPEAGVAPWYQPPRRKPNASALPDLETLGASLMQTTAAAGAAAATSAAAVATPALAAALTDRDGTAAQRSLLLLALYRSLGLRARLVVVLQPPPLRPPPEGKLHPTPPEPPPGAPHIPLWLEVYVDGLGRWVSLDAAEYGHPVLDQPERTLEVRAPFKGAASRAAAARAYVVAYDQAGVRDVTPRYVSNVAAAHANRTDAAWWGAALAAVPSEQSRRAAAAAAAAAAAGGGTSSSPSSSGTALGKRPIALDDSDDDDEGGSRRHHVRPPAAAAPSTPSSSSCGAAHASASHASSSGARKRRKSAAPVGTEVVDVEEEEASGRRRDAEDEELRRRQEQQPLPSSLAEYKRHPVYILQRDLKSTQVHRRPKRARARDWGWGLG